MNNGEPSAFLRLLAHILLPPARREEILGDLYERYCSQTRFFIDALRTIPLVIFSQVRRKADPRLLVPEALALGLSFYGSAAQFDRAFLIVIPTITGCLALLICDAYSDPRTASPWAVVRDSGICLAVACLSQVPLALAAPALAIPGSMLLSGAAWALGFLILLRATVSFPRTHMLPNNQLNTRHRKLGFMVVLFAVVLSAVWNLARKNGPPAEISYSEVLNQLETGQIVSAEVNTNGPGAGRLLIRTASGRFLSAVVPSDERITEMLVRNRVDISFARPTEWPKMLANSMPFLVLLTIWVIMMLYLRKRPRPGTLG